MIRISVLYPNMPGARFDHDYYADTHIPMARDMLGAALHAVTVERGVSPGSPWPEPAYLAVVHFDCESLEAYQAALWPHMAKLQADVANFSSVIGLVMVSEVWAG
jgi:uncharacterized protein (TIGR02118 family)